MHDERPRRMAAPTADHCCARPRRRGFDMVRPPFVKYAVKRFLVIEVAVTAVDRQSRRRNRDEESARTSLNDLVTLSRSNDHDFVAEACRGSKLGVDIGAHAAAGGCVEGAHVDNSHAVEKPRIAENLK